MTKVYGPFDTGAGAAVVEDTWRKFASRYLTSGVLKGHLNELSVYADSSGMQIKVRSGAGYCAGHFFEDDSEEVIAVAASDPTNPRIDRLVLSADFTANTIDFAILQGSPGGTPTPAALTQNLTAKWEIPLGQALVGAGVTTIASNAITDERVFTGEHGTTLLLNSSGGTVNRGDVVIMNSGADKSFTTTTTADHTSVFGVVLDEAIANGAMGRVALGTGMIVQVAVNAATSRLDRLATSTTVKKAKPSAIAGPGDFAVALTATAGAAMVWAILTGPGGQAPAFSATVTTEAIGDAANAGTAINVSRGDHLHGFPAAAIAGASTVVDTAATGSAGTLSRSDHRHSREGFAAPAASAVGDAQAAGGATTVPHADHVHAREGFAAPVASAVGDTQSTGSALTIPHSDHRHAREGFASPGASNVGDTSSDGTSASLVRADHRHARETFAAPSASAVGDAQVNGVASTVPHSDHVHAREAFATPGASAVGDSAAQGVATSVPRSDHRHSREAFAAPVASAVGDVQAAGSAATVPHSDHVHAREGFGAVTAQTSFGGASTNGAATTVAHSDHAHGTPANPTLTSLASRAHSELTGIGADDHHAKSHVHLSDGSGTVAHSSTSGQTADDHHAKSHGHTGADGSGTVAHSATTGQTANDHHARDHATTHSSGGADPITVANLAGNLTQARSHDSADTDAGTSSLHHTVGAGATQAAAGNHLHDTLYAKLLSHTELSVNTTSVQLTLSGFRNYRILYRARTLAAGTIDALRCRLNADAGANYWWWRLYGSNLSAPATDGTGGGADTSVSIGVAAGNSGVNADVFASGEVVVHDAGSHKATITGTGGLVIGSANGWMGHIHGLYDVVGAITSITFFGGAADMMPGTCFDVYGMP